MNTGKSLRLSASNWLLTIKVILTQLITISAFVSIAALFMTDTINNVLSAVEETQVVASLQNLIALLYNSNFDSAVFLVEFEAFIKSAQDAIALVPNFYRQFVIANIIFIIGFFVAKTVNGFWDLPLTSSLNEFMVTSNSRPYMWWYCRNIGKSVIFQLLYMALTFFWDFFNIIGVVALFVYALSALGGVGVAVAILLWMALFSLRLTVFAFWLPAYSADTQRSVTVALSDGLKTIIDRFFTVFLQTFIVVALTGAVLIVAVFHLRNLVVLVIVAAICSYAYYLIKCMNMVEYYEVKKSPYFVKPVNLGLEEQNDA